MTDYDILMISDLRLAGGNTASMAEEIRAQSAAGYSTALFHVNTSYTSKDLGISRHIARCVDDGLADLILPDEPLHARHVVLRHPAAAESIDGQLPWLSADSATIVANHPAVNAAGISQYDPLTANAAVERCFGVVPRWHSIGPAVQRTLEPFASAIELADEPWVNLIDVDDWATDRGAGVAHRPVIGRHSRPHPDKWPNSAADILSAYPDSSDVLVRILGGAWPVRHVLGGVPARWIVEDFGTREPIDFLAEVDFFVYFHHPEWIEAYGRTIMEAMASGAVAILPEHFRDAYGDAAVYSTPDDVMSVVNTLSADTESYLAQSRRGQQFVASRHGYQIHVDRLTRLIGPPRGTPKPIRPRHRQRERTRILYVSSNGTGMGHLTRLLAMATRTDARVEPFFFSMSSAVSVVAKYGYAWEYFPSLLDLDTKASSWNPAFAKRFDEIVRRYAPRAVVFDGTWPYNGIGESRGKYGDMLYVWSRRGMWHADHNTEQLEKSSWFDLVIEPGEFAASADVGPTTTRGDAVHVDPITLLGRTDVLDRERARAELGIDPDSTVVLVTLGAGNVNDLTSDLDVIADVARRRPGWQVYATAAPIARTSIGDHSDVNVLSVYPLARYLAAFDVAVVAAGYNAYHESIMAAVPSIFVPKPKRTDNQHARARYAEQAGVGLCVEDVTADAMEHALEQILSPNESKQMRERCIDLYPENGAATAQGLVEQLMAERGVIS